MQMKPFLPSFKRALDCSLPSFKGALSRYSVIFFVDFLRQKNGADLTEAAPDQTNRGAGLVKNPRIAIDRATRLAGTGARESKACDTTLVAKASSRADVSHRLVLPRYRAVFPRSRVKTMAEIESDISQFSCSGQLAPVSLAPVLCKCKGKCAQREGKRGEVVLARLQGRNATVTVRADHASA